MGIFNADWVKAVVGECDPVFNAAKADFEGQVLTEGPDGQAHALLWEANPTMFAERYPDSGIVETYGATQWPDVHCIDWWVYLDPSTRQARISVEGWNLPELHLALSGDGVADGCALADVLARLLAVPSPRTG